ncbi:hypothetical protein LZ31DRAFT_67081 [Colletotrichum somersetense]|nr:hypothetical protein LZ31DRAFT_67081 [Colletotrichum somersetense]
MFVPTTSHLAQHSGYTQLLSPVSLKKSRPELPGPNQNESKSKTEPRRGARIKIWHAHIKPGLLESPPDQSPSAAYVRLLTPANRNATSSTTLITTTPKRLSTHIAISAGACLCHWYGHHRHRFVAVNAASKLLHVTIIQACDRQRPHRRTQCVLPTNRYA